MLSTLSATCVRDDKMHFFFSILTLSTILAPVYAWRNVAEVNREMVVIPPDDAHIQFVGVEYKTATKKLREFYNYPNTADPTKWEGMHKLLEVSWVWFFTHSE